MKRIRKHLAALLSAVLLLGLLPVTSLAAPASWASDAVTALYNVYDVTFLSDDSTPMTIEAAADFFDAVGYETTETGPMTRSKACDILAQIYNLPVGSGADAAIRYLYEKNVINGYKGEAVNLGEDDPIDQASFAVLTYRVLNFVGGGGGSTTALKPGTKEYFSWMYLAARRAVEFQSNTNDKFDSDEWADIWNGYESTEKNEDGTDRLDEDGNPIPLHVNGWKEWLSVAVDHQDISGKFDAAKAAVDTLLTNAADGKVSYLQAAVAGVNELEVETIFIDVVPGDYYYDGVMYLFDQGIVSGYGDGAFRPRERLNRGSMVILMGEINDTLGTEIERIKVETDRDWEIYAPRIVELAQDLGYVDWNGDDFDPSEDVTRRELIMGFLNASSAAGEIDGSNLEVLERFDDYMNMYDPEEDPAAHSLAYAVSHGMVSGSNDPNGPLLLPDRVAERGVAGVLLYHVLIGLDKTKMRDYEENVEFVMPDEEGGSGETYAAIQTFSPVMTLADDGTVADPPAVEEEPEALEELELALREDWRLTGTLDLNVPDGYILTIDGNAPNSGGPYFIYEMDGELTNSGDGFVYFRNTALYPQSGETISSVAYKHRGDTLQVSVRETAEDGFELSMPVIADFDDYELVIMASNNEDVIDLNGTIEQPVYNTTVTLTLALFDEESSYAGAWRVPVAVPGVNGEMPSPDVNDDPNSTGGYTYDDTDDDSSSAPANTTVTTTTRNPDGSTTTKKTDKATGAVTETTTRPDGSVKVVETAKNGTVTTKETAANGVEVTTVQARGSSVTASVTLPDDVDSATVTIPVTTTLTPGTVAVDSKTGEVIKLSVATAGGMAVKLDHSADFVLVDRSKNFSDTTGHWAGNSIAFVTSHELFYGTGDSTFSPELPTTRAMLMTVLARLDSTASSASIGYEQGMAWAVSTGVSDGSNPDGEITREQLATMLWRYAGSPASSYAVTHPDAGAISDYAQTAMSWAVQVGILTGYEDGTLRPEASATRAVVAAMLQRFCATLV